MMTIKPTAQILPPTPENIAHCAHALNQGELVAFPTETVFGLGALVNNTDAVSRIFVAKGRPSDHPLIAHVAPNADLTGWVSKPSQSMQKLMDAFWPGPLTLVVPKGPKMPSEVTGGQNSVGIRCPSHPVAQALLALVNAPVAAPSANRFGKVSPTRARHVQSELGSRISCILDGSIPDVGVESTIVSLLGTQAVLLRPGAITPEQIQAVLGMPVLRPGQHANNPRVSGALEKHYSPDAKVSIVAADELNTFFELLPKEGKTLVVGWSDVFLALASELGNEHLVAIRPCTNKAAAVSHDLYCLLRLADEDGYDRIVFEKPVNNSEWEAVADRLKRACA